MCSSQQMVNKPPNPFMCKPELIKVQAISAAILSPPQFFHHSRQVCHSEWPISVTGSGVYWVFPSGFCWLFLPATQIQSGLGYIRLVGYSLDILTSICYSPNPFSFFVLFSCEPCLPSVHAIASESGFIISSFF